jgi:hypothetical protein
MRSFRQQFADFKKSSVGQEITKYLYNKQLGLCPINKCSIFLNSKAHLSHIIPLSYCERINRYDLCIDERNLFLELGKSNVKRSNKVVDELLEDLLLEIDLSQKELVILKEYINSPESMLVLQQHIV